MKDRRKSAFVALSLLAGGATALGLLLPFPCCCLFLVPLLGIVSILLLGLFQNSGFFIPVLQSVKSRERIIALTFDDGPHPDFTPRILDILDRYNAKACFFCLGWRVETYPEVAREIHRRGHELGNHSDRHSIFLPLFPPGRLRREVAGAQRKFKQVLGLKPVFYRQPLGLLSPWLARVLSKEGLVLVGFSLLAQDNRPGSPEEIAAAIGKRLKPGGILAMHDGLANRPHDREKSVKTLPLVLEEIRSRGYRVVLPGTLLGLR